MINFLRYNKLFYAISLLFIIPSVISMLTVGFKPSIDFVGGTNLDYQFNPQVSVEQVGTIIESKEIELQEIEQNNTVMTIRTEALNEDEEKILREEIETDLKTTVTVLKTETVGPVIGREMVEKTIVASSIAIVGILLYIAYAFRNFNFAIATIIGLIHDIVIVAGLYSIIGYFYGAELDTLFVTALLTTMSFSVHDTIVMFDQLRDYEKKNGPGNIEEHANRAVTDTLMRSINNSMTIVFTLLALVLLGGSTIRFFALTLLIGTIVGTYSSPFTSIPIAVWLEKRKK